MENSTRDPNERERARERIAADVEAFLRRGGRIQEVAMGTMTEAHVAHTVRRPPAYAGSLIEG